MSKAKTLTNLEPQHNTWMREYQRLLYEERRFDEGSLNTIMTQSKKGMIIISTGRSSVNSSIPGNDLSEEFEAWCYKTKRRPNKASEDKYLEERNAQADRELKEELKSGDNPYVYIPVYGAYKGKDEVVDESEKSYIIFNSYNRYKGKQGSWEDLYERALEWCIKYKQDSVFVQPPNQPPYYANQQGQRISKSSSGKFKFNVESETYFTTIKRKKSASNFTADIIFENYIRRDLPASLIDKMRRTQYGELWKL